MKGLYVHIPFCVRKCHYCDFYSIAGQTGLIDDYVNALFVEAEKYRGMEFQTLYIGGGTPSLLGARCLENLMDGLSERFDLSKLQEASIEVNPESATLEFLKSAVSLGINRLSIGVQSLNDDELTKSGRIHNMHQALDAVDNSFGCGLTNVSADIIIGLPGQTLESLTETINNLCAMDLTHISAYCLSIEDRTSFAISPPPDLPNDDSQSVLFNRTALHLKQRGYVHYEISNFSLPGRECEHNLNYWRGGEYVGLGPSAASHLNGIRMKNSADLPRYLLDPLAIEVEVEALDHGRKMSEEAMLRLRMLEEGLDITMLSDKFCDCRGSDIKNRLDRMADNGFLAKAGNIYRLPEDGVLTSNQVFVNVID